MATVSLQSAFDAARRALDAGTADRAVAVARYTLSHYPRNIEAQRLLGEALLNAGEAEAAAEAFGKVLEADPESVAAYYGRGLAFAARDDRMAAMRSFERALEIQPNLAELRSQLIRMYGEAPGSSPQLRLSRAGLARLYTRGGMYSQAVDEFRAIEAEADRPDVEAALAEALWRDGQEDEAAAYCRQTLGRRPGLLKPRLLLGYLLYAGGQPEGEELWRAGAQQDPALTVARGLFDILPPIRLEEPLLPAFDIDELVARSFAAEQAAPSPNEGIAAPERGASIAALPAEPIDQQPAGYEQDEPGGAAGSFDQDTSLAVEAAGRSGGGPVAPPRDMLSDDALLASLLGIDLLSDEQVAAPESPEQPAELEGGREQTEARPLQPEQPDYAPDAADFAASTRQDTQATDDDTSARMFESIATGEGVALAGDEPAELEPFDLDELVSDQGAASFSSVNAADQPAPWDDPAFALGDESRSEEADAAPFDELPAEGPALAPEGFTLLPEQSEPDATRDLFSLDDLADDTVSWEQGQQVSPADEEQMPFSLAELGIDAEELSAVQAGAPDTIAPPDDSPPLAWDPNPPEPIPSATPDVAGPAQNTPAADGGAPVKRTGRPSDAGSFSLADLGLTDDEIAALDIHDAEPDDEDASSGAAASSQANQTTRYGTPAGSTDVPGRPQANGLSSVFQQLEADPQNPSLRLGVARLASQSGDTAQALEHYRQLVRSGKLLDDVAGDLEDLIGDGGDVQLLRRLHRLLGDTYMKQNRVEEALDQYSWTSEKQ